MEHSTNTSEIEFSDFLKVNILIGTIIAAEANVKARKPAYIIQIDFGDFGTKMSSAQITENYSPQELIGRQIIAVTNFPTKKVAGVNSEVLILAAVCNEKGTVLIQPSSTVKNGTRIL